MAQVRYSAKMRRRSLLLLALVLACQSPPPDGLNPSDACIGRTPQPVPTTGECMTCWADGDVAAGSCRLDLGAATPTELASLLRLSAKLPEYCLASEPWFVEWTEELAADLHAAIAAGEVADTDGLIAFIARDIPGTEPPQPMSVTRYSTLIVPQDSERELLRGLDDLAYWPESGASPKSCCLGQGCTADYLCVPGDWHPDAIDCEPAG